MSNLLSYSQIIKDRNNFRKAGTKSGGDFNYFDIPGLKFFKIFFYFNNGDSDGIANDTTSGGLLAPTWESKDANASNRHEYNSAWSYLKMNCEDDRADLLQQFVNLLSNISSESPWYFSELTGIDEALDRKTIMEKDFKIEEARHKISIKCLPDSYDNRIGTLLDLYRSIVWSWQLKKEILPSNLRKFDMGVFIYNDPVSNFALLDERDTELKATPGRLYPDETDLISSFFNSKDKKDPNNTSKINYEYSLLGPENEGNEYKSSYKYIEFHNCEIDYNSAKTPWGTLSNIEGVSPQYNIDIYFDDCYEYGYNEFNMKSFGDLIIWDYDYKLGMEKYMQNSNDVAAEKSLDERLNYYTETNGVRYSNIPNPHTPQYKKGIMEKIGGAVMNAAAQVVNVASDAVTGIVKKAVLGNLYTFSLTRMVGQAKSLMQGNVWSTARNVSEYVNDAQQRNEYGLPVGHSLFSKPTKILPTVKKIGNMHQANTLANNI